MRIRIFTYVCKEYCSTYTYTNTCTYNVIRRILDVFPN